MSLSEWDPKARMGKVVYPIMKRVRVITTFVYEDGRQEDVTWFDTESFGGHMGVDKAVHIRQERHLEKIWRAGDLDPSEIRDRGVFDLNVRLEYPSRIIESRKLPMDENRVSRLSRFSRPEDR
jgi:hypothetical protein